MQTITESEVDRLLYRLQRVAEQAPVHLRPKRRQIVRGMRCALAAMADAPTLEQLRDQLVYELTGALPEAPVVRVVPEVAERAPSELELQITQALSAGKSPSAIVQELGCSTSTVYRAKRLLDE